MTSRDFCFWLQGYMELTHNAAERELTAGQVACVKKHLALVFKHEIDPSMGNQAQQQDLNSIHSGLGLIRC